jgi:disulfide bond formation protein DsbB
MNLFTSIAGNPRISLHLAALASAMLLAAAFAFEHFMGLEPCTMCIWQRWPHRIMVALGLAAFLLPHGKIRPIMLVGLIALAAGAGVAGWHSGVEWGILPGPTACSGGVSLDGDPSAALDALLASAPVRCDEVPWSLFGLSMANWNMIASAALAAFMLISFQRSAVTGR